VKGSEYTRDTTLDELEKAIDEIIVLNGETLAPKPKPEDVQKEVIRAALEQADFLLQAKKQAEPDTYPETQEQLEQAQMDSQHYNMTTQFLQQARVERSIQAVEVFPQLDPLAVKRVVEPPPPDYKRTQQQLTEARAWQPPSVEVFKQLSPTALKKVQVPAPEYTGLHSENNEISALLQKFEAA